MQRHPILGLKVVDLSDRVYHRSHISSIFAVSPRPFIAKKILTLSVSGLQTKIRKIINEQKGLKCKSRTVGALWLKSYYPKPIFEGHKLIGERSYIAQ